MTPAEEIGASRGARYHGAVTGKLIALQEVGRSLTDDISFGVGGGPLLRAPTALARCAIGIGGSIGSDPWGPGPHTAPRPSADLISGPRPAAAALGPDPGTPVNDGDAPTVAALQIRAPIVTVTSRARRSPSHPATGERSA